MYFFVLIGLRGLSVCKELRESILDPAVDVTKMSPLKELIVNTKAVQPRGKASGKVALLLIQ